MDQNDVVKTQFCRKSLFRDINTLSWHSKIFCSKLRYFRQKFMYHVVTVIQLEN